MGIDTARYLQLIGHTGSQAPQLATLADIQLRHTLTFAFENIDPLLKRPVLLDLASLEDKFLRQGRGGYCYEHNILLQAVLVSLGFTVTGLAARVLWGVPPGAVRARTHMLLKVDLPEGAFLVDAGFGALTPTGPVALVPGEPQPTPHESFRLVQDGEQLRLEGEVESCWRPLYSFDLQPQNLADYEVASWYVSTHPNAGFISRLVATRVAPGGRNTLEGNQLAYYPKIGPIKNSSQQTLDTPAALREALEDIFGIRLPQDDRLEAMLAQQAHAPAP